MAEVNSAGTQQVRSLQSFLSGDTAVNVPPQPPPPTQPNSQKFRSEYEVGPSENRNYPDHSEEGMGELLVSDSEGLLHCTATAFFDAESDLASIFNSPVRNVDNEDTKKYETQIRNLEMDIVTLMDEMDSLNSYKVESQKEQASLQLENDNLKDEIKQLKTQSRERKDEVSYFVKKSNDTSLKISINEIS